MNGLSPQGYNYEIDPGSVHPFWENNGGSGETDDGLVKNISIENENGVYTVKQTKTDSKAESGETTTDVGTIEVPETNTLIAEINDDVVENTADGYDFHTIKETQNDTAGTQNNVGQFYLSQKQITAIEKTDSGLDVKTVDQSGKTGTQVIEIGGVTLHKYEYDKNQLNIILSSGKIANYGSKDDWYIPGTIRIYINKNTYAFVSAFQKWQYNTMNSDPVYSTVVEEVDGKQIVYFIKLSIDSFSSSANYTNAVTTIYSNSAIKPEILYMGLYFATVPNSAT